jgi:hypothetical protein
MPAITTTALEISCPVQRVTPHRKKPDVVTADVGSRMPRERGERPNSAEAASLLDAVETPSMTCSASAMLRLA